MDTITATFPCRCKSDGKPCMQTFPSLKARGRHEREQHTSLLPGMYTRKGTDGTVTYYGKVKLADGKFHDRAFGTNKKAAMTNFQELRADARRQKHGMAVARALTEIIQLYKDLNFGRLAKDTQRSYTATMDLFCTYLRTRAHNPETMKLIKVSDVEGFRESMLAKGVAASTINLRLVVLSNMYHWAVERDFAAEPNPFRRCKRVKAGRPNPEWLKRHELVAVINKARALDATSWSDTPYADIFAVLAFTGMRPSELTRCLRWEDVDLEARLINVRNRPGANTKTKCDRVIPISPQVFEVLERLRAGRNAPTGLVFTVARENIRLRIQKVYKELGFVGKDLYTLRHTFASLSIQAGVPLEVVQKLMGHAHISMTLRYAHVATESIESGVARMSDFCAAVAADATGVLRKVD